MANDNYQGGKYPDEGDGMSGKPPSWTKPGKGSFTGIDYNVAGAADGLDPYLVWSDTNGFANLRKPGQKRGDRSHIPARLPVLAELGEGASLDDLMQFREKKLLFVEDAYLRGKEGDLPKVIPLQVPPGFFDRKSRRALQHFIKRIELDLPEDVAPRKEAAFRSGLQQGQTTNSQGDDTSKLIANATRIHSANALFSGKVFAFIDDGCAFAHAHFLTGSGNNVVPRVKRLWDQNERAATSLHFPPAGFSEGREFTDADLKAMILARTYAGAIDEAAVYADFALGTRDNINRLRGRVAHGTHVMDIACGPYMLEDTMCTRHKAPAANPTWETTQDEASCAPVIFVQLPMRTVQNTSGKGTMTADVLNALQYISAQCDAHAKIVVNLSWGTLAGPHNGSTILETGIDNAINAQPKGRLRVVIPAGNGLQSRTHSRLAFKKDDAPKTIQWRVPADDATESYIELWMEACDKVEVTVTLPNGDQLPPFSEGTVLSYLDPSQPFADPVSIFGVNYVSAPPQGQTGKCVLFAIAPTTSLLGSRPVAPHGLWQITIKNVIPHQPIKALDAYIERDDVAIGTRRGARQSFFDDPLYRKHETEDAASRPSAAYVFREGVFNGIGNGRRVVCAGGVRESDLTPAEYSPTGIYTLPARPDTKQKVDYFATSEESRTLHGVRAAGTRSGGVVRLSGTSDAAPQIARDMINDYL